MNIVCLEVKIGKCRVGVSGVKQVAFSLRFGSVLSELSEVVKVDNKGQILQGTSVSISCDEETLKEHSRACLVVYSIDAIEKKIIGMAFILSKSKEEYRDFKIQQCADKHASISVKTQIQNLQVRRPSQNGSQTSKSSLNEIKQLHKQLSKTKRFHRHTNSDIREATEQVENDPKYRQTSEANDISLEDDHMEPAQLSQHQYDYDRNDLIDQLEEKLNEAYQRNTILTNMLVIEERKYRTAYNFINSYVLRAKNNGTIINDSSSINLPELPTPATRHGDVEKQKQKQIEQNLLQYHSVAKERDDLFKMCEDLYKKVKVLKQQNEKIMLIIKQKEAEVQYHQEDVEDIKRENIELKSKLFQAYDKEQMINRNTILEEENKKLKQKNLELERKFQETYKAIQNFKNDALEAREEIITKDGEIEELRKQMLDYRRNRVRTQESMDEDKIGCLRQAVSRLEENEKKNLIHFQYLLKLQNQNMEKEERQQIQIQERMTNLVAEFYKEQTKKSIRSLRLIDIRKILMGMINSL